VADRATSGLERSPPGRTDRHHSDHGHRLAIVCGRERTTDVPLAEGRRGNANGRVGTGGVGRDVARQHRDEGDTAAGRAVALGQTRSAVRPRGNRPPRHTVGTNGLRSLGRPVVSSQPIAATRLGSAASQEQNGKRSQDTHDGDHEGSRSEPRCKAWKVTTHGKKPGIRLGPPTPWPPPTELHRPNLPGTVDRPTGCVNESAAGRQIHLAAWCRGVSFPSLSASQTVFACGSAMRTFPARSARPTGPLSGLPVIHLVAVPSAATFQTARA
jgi:hypothetical protein